MTTLQMLSVRAALAGLLVGMFVGASTTPAQAGPPTGSGDSANSAVVSETADCADSVCLFSETNFGGTVFDAGFPDTSCATAPFPARSASNNIIFHVELYADTNCQDFTFFLESGQSNAALPAPVRSYKAFICGQECLTSAGMRTPSHHTPAAA